MNATNTTFSALQQTVSNGISGSSFRFNPDWLNQASFNTLLSKLFPQGQLLLNGIQKDLASSSLTISGNFSNAAFGPAPVHCQMVFSIQNDTPSCVMNFTGFASSWNLADVFPSLKGGILDHLTISNGSLTISSNTAPALPANFAALWNTSNTSVTPASSIGGIEFSCTAALSDLPPGIGSFLSNSNTATVALSGAIDLMEVSASPSKYRPALWLKASQKGQMELLGQKLGLEFSALNIPATGSGTSAQSFYNLSSTLNLSASGQQLSLPISANFGSGTSPLITFLCKPSGKAPIDFEDLSAFLGVSSLSSLVPTSFPALQQTTIEQLSYSIAPGSLSMGGASLSLSTPPSWSWSTLNGLLDFKQLDAQLSLSMPSSSAAADAASAPSGSAASGPVLSLSLSGEVAFYGTTLEATISLPSMAISLKLPNGQTMNLSQCVGTLIGSTNLPSGNLNCNQFDLSATPAQKQYSFRASLSDSWSHTIGSQNVDLKQASLHLESNNGSNTLSVSGTASIGSIQATASLAYANSAWTFSAAQQSGQVPIGSFIQDLSSLFGTDFSVPNAISSLEMSAFSLQYASNTKTLQGNLSIQEGQPIEIAGCSMNLGLSASFNSGASGTSASCTFSGTWAVGSEQFSVELSEQSGSLSFAAQWQATAGSSLGFEDLATALGISHDLSVPSSLNLSLTAVTVAYDASTEQFVISASTASGDAFFFSQKTAGGQAAFVFGVALDGTENPSDIPGIGSQFKALDSLSLSQVQIYLASESLSSVSMPSLPKLPGGSSPQITALPQQGIQQGISVSANLDLSTTSNTEIKHAASMVAEDALTLMITADPSNDSVTASCNLASPATISTGSGSGKISIEQCRFYVTATEDDFTVNLAGSWSFPMFGQTIDTTIRVTLSDDEADVAIELQDKNGTFPAPPGVKGLHLQSIGLEMGIEFDPPSVEFGISGQAVVGSGSGDQGDFSIVLAFDADVPNPLYLSFSLEQLDVSEAIALFTNENEDSALDFLKAEDLSFYWCETPQTLPSGLVTQPGFGFSGAVSVLDFDTYAEMEISATQGVSGDFTCSPIHLGSFFSLTGNGQAVQLKQGGKTQTVVPAGGPVFTFNTNAL